MDNTITQHALTFDLYTGITFSHWATRCAPLIWLQCSSAVRMAARLLAQLSTETLLCEVLAGG